MGRKLDALLGRSKSSKLKPVLGLALSRLVILKQQRQAKFSQSRSDVLQLLQLGNHERALLRVEQVIKEQNMLDVYVMIDRYCNLLIERVHLIEQERECPEELREAASSVIYAASRCGDFPELQEIRSILGACFGKEFTARSVELRNNCGVSLLMTQKLATRMPARDIRMKLLKEIAAENSVLLNLEETSGSIEDNVQAPPPPQPHASSSSTAGSAEVLQAFKDETEKDDKYSKKQYKDVAHAAQAAFESAAYAAAAARAAVELSRDSDDQNSPGPKRGNLSSRYVSSKTELKSQNEHITPHNQTEEHKRSASSSSSDSEGDKSEVTPSVSSDAIGQPSHPRKDTVFDDSDNEQSTKSTSPTRVPLSFQSGMKIEPEGSSRRLTLNPEKGPFSLRNRRIFGH